ncbi:MAG: FliI/YscN family ATPase [Myxococcota bacterium]
MSFDTLRYRNAIERSARPRVDGKLCEVLGLVLEARGCHASIGDLFEIRAEGGRLVEAEVVGLRGGRTLLMPLGPTEGLEVGLSLRRSGKGASARVGDAMLGRVLDGLGRPIDDCGDLALSSSRPLYGASRNPLRRQPVQSPLTVGVRAIDGLLTMGEGQRIGIFAGGGVGKSSLLAMMVRQARADVCVVALIGERGREVEEFVHRTLGPEGMRHSVVVAATSSDPPLVRARGALLATTIAEHFRDSGKRVLLVMDSLTRFAMALREVGLAVGEPPTTKGYTPTVFAALPRLLERAGTGEKQGSITGVYTVLVEGDDLSDPIADTTRAILDGHVVLSRDLAEKGHFPAIDVPSSISRVMRDVTDSAQVEISRQVRSLLSAYREAEDLVAIGAYQRGSLPRLDAALERMPKLEAFLRQRTDEYTGSDDVRQWLDSIFKEES